MKRIETNNAPKAIGPYSQGIISDKFIFTSGQIPLDPKTNQLVMGPIEEQTEQVLENIKNILEAARSSLEKVIKVTVYMANLNEFQEMNAIYEKYLPHKPARSTVQVSALPKGAKVEIEVIAER